MISSLLVRRTLATLRIAELGFLGVVVYTLVHTPRRCGQESKAADLLLLVGLNRPFLTNCDIVGILDPLYYLILLVLQLVSDLRDGKDKNLISSRNHFSSNYFGHFRRYFSGGRRALRGCS